MKRDISFVIPNFEETKLHSQDCRLQVFDGLVVLMVCAMELLFTIFWDEVLCYDEAVEAATYLIVLRFCRIPRACSGKIS